MKFRSLLGLTGLLASSSAFALSPAQQLAADTSAIARYLVEHASPLEIYGNSITVPYQHCYSLPTFSVGAAPVVAMFCNESPFPVSLEHPLHFTPGDYLTLSSVEVGNPKSITCVETGIDGFQITKKGSPSDLVKTTDKQATTWIGSWASSWDAPRLEKNISLCAPFIASVRQELSAR